jgi:hypothetical protein
MPTLTIPLPGLRLVSLANQREHWRSRARRAKSQRYIGELTVKAALREPRGEPFRFPVTVIITRIAPRALDDDNLAGAAKSVRDGVADALGIDDRDPRVKWAVAQRKGRPREYGAEVELTWNTDAAGERQRSNGK